MPAADAVFAPHHPAAFEQHQDRSFGEIEQKLLISAIGDEKIVRASEMLSVTYWVAGPKSWDVVTTIDPLVGDEAENDGRAILRFSSQLLPGQSQTISIPAVSGARFPFLLIRHFTDSLVVETAPTLSD